MDLERLKSAAAKRAVDYVKDGMLLGIGSGSTAQYAITEIGRRLKERKLLDITAVATSNESEALAKNAGIKIIELGVDWLDLAIDGADEISPNLDLIKGLGAALLREKMVERQSREFIVVADYTKMVNHLGEKNPVPLEIVRFGYESTISRLSEFGKAVLRTKNSQPIVTDNGNFVVDLKFAKNDVHALNRNLKQITGVVETGFFINMATRVIVASDSEIKEFYRN